MDEPSSPAHEDQPKVDPDGSFLVLPRADWPVFHVGMTRPDGTTPMRLHWGELTPDQ